MEKELFIQNFNRDPEYYAECGGRFEILGNHTDHNHGCCLAATCDLKIYGYTAKRDDMKVNVVSKGFEPFSVDLHDLAIYESLFATSTALIRGIASYYFTNGYNIGGFDLYIESTIFPGAGVSSSAAFEMLIAQIYNVLYNQGKVDKLVMAKASQYAENAYFGKKCGLLDQIGTGYGNISFIDFKDIANPKVENIVFPFDDLHFVIVNTGGSHAKLSDLYSAIPMDMLSAAKKAGVEFLRESDIDTVLASLDLTEIEKTRSMHFFDENNRVLQGIEAINNKDEELFLRSMNGSRVSSTHYLKNMMVGNKYEGSPLEACDIAMRAMNGNGACKINGGGFAGSIICCVPDQYLDFFNQVMMQRYGVDNVKEVHIKTTPVTVEKL